VVMYVGKVAEVGPTDVIFDTPHHPYTKALLGASPDLEDDRSQFRGLEGSVPDPARPPQGCRFHTRCPVATPVCGWDVDDVVLRLQDEPGLFDKVDGVEHRGPFDADLRFGDPAAAIRLVALIESDRVPAAMREAVEVLSMNDRTVSIKFHEVDEVELTRRGPGHLAACVLGEQAST
ncbi:MAG: hypothetical protein M3N43_11090, partial [Actinomycetota bacterium]|nr:hypothetical protein [Actinomycetota bacterium]